MTTATITRDPNVQETETLRIIQEGISLCTHTSLVESAVMRDILLDLQQAFSKEQGFEVKNVFN